MMQAYVETLHGRGTAYAGPIARRILPTSLQNPNFFRPGLRSGLKQRQEAAMRERLQDKKKRWDDWEQQGPRVPPIVRNDPIQQQQQQKYQQAYQQSETARLTKEEQLDDIQRRLQDRIKQRQRRTDRWIPPQYAEDAVAQRAAEQQARAAAREARRQQEEERLRREASDAAVAAQFLQGRVRQKASRFADLVEIIQESKQNKNPYRSRREDDEVTPNRMTREQQRQQQEVTAENSPYTNATNYNGNNTKGSENGRYDYDQRQDSSAYLPPDVVRVQRGAANSQIVTEVVMESGEDEEPVMIWTAGAEGLVQEPMRATLEEAEYTDVVDVEELKMEEEERSFQQQQQQQQRRRRWQQGDQQVAKKFSLNSSPDGNDDEYIDW